MVRSWEHGHVFKCKSVKNWVLSWKSVVSSIKCFSMSGFHGETFSGVLWNLQSWKLFQDPCRRWHCSWNSWLTLANKSCMIFHNLRLGTATTKTTNAVVFTSNHFVIRRRIGNSPWHPWDLEAVGLLGGGSRTPSKPPSFHWTVLCKPSSILSFLLLAFQNGQNS